MANSIVSSVWFRMHCTIHLFGDMPKLIKYFIFKEDHPNWKRCQKRWTIALYNWNFENKNENLITWVFDYAAYRYRFHLIPRHVHGFSMHGDWQVGFPKSSRPRVFDSIFYTHQYTCFVLQVFSCQGFQVEESGISWPFTTSWHKEKSFTLECRLFILYTVKLVALCYTNWVNLS